MTTKNNHSSALRIVYLDFDDVKNPLLAGGQAWATLEVGKRLAAKGHQVISLCSRYPGSKDRTEHGIHYKHIGLGSPWIRLNNVFYILSLPFSVWRQKADIVIECFTAPITTLGSPLYAGAPVVALPSQFAAGEFARKYKLPFDWIEWLLLPYYRYFLPYTEAVLDRMKRRNPEIVAQVVPHGAAPEYFHLKHQKGEYILCLGRLDIDQKGLDLLLAAYAKVAGQIKLPLVIAGHGADSAKVAALVESYQLADQVKLLGATYGQKKLDVMSKAAFVAFPSRYDDLPIFLIEALAAGLPVVSFDIPDLQFLTDNMSFKAKAFDIDDYAQQLLTASQSSKLATISEFNRRFAQGYSWDKVADQFEAFFGQILRRQNA